MIATLQRTAIASIILALIIIVSAGNLAFAAPTPTSTTPRSEVRELLDVSDIIYYAPEPAQIEFTEAPTEVTPESELEPVLEETYQEEYYEEPSYSYDYSYTSQNTLTNGEYITAADFQQLGIIHDGIWSYTYYSENVLPGGGLEIPGRHTDKDGYVCDGKGAVCVASDDLPQGTVVSLHRRKRQDRSRLRHRQRPRQLGYLHVLVKALSRDRA